jgi:LCP family protein required for cell wall assembly
MIAGIVVAVLSGLFAGGAKLLDMYVNSKAPQEPLLSPDPKGKDISGPINILMLGMDKRATNNETIGTDSIIILHVNAAHTRAYLVSLPRDLLVSAPAYPPSKFDGLSQLKLTDVFRYGNRTFNSNGGAIGDDTPAGRARGIGLLTQVINGLIPGGITFNAVAIINYSGFEKIVNVLGGVYMCVDENTWSNFFDKTGKYHGDYHSEGVKLARAMQIAYFYKQGCRTLLPWEALDYVRQRYYLQNGEGDYGRQRHQQQFLAAVFKQMLSRQTLTDVSKLHGLMNAAGQLLTYDLRGNDLLDFLFTLRNIGAGDLAMIKNNADSALPFASKDVMIDGVKTSFETITAGETALWQAVHDDTVDQFLAAHPKWVGAAS